MDFEQELRKLAKSVYWQNIYQNSQELSNINLFSNSSNFSGIQVLFLYWLKVYHTIYDDFQNKEYDFLDEELIKDNIRTDAFLFWRKKKYEFDRIKSKKEDESNKFNKNSKPGNKTYCNVDLRGE